MPANLYWLGHPSLAYPSINVIFHTKLFYFNFLFICVYISFIHKNVTASSGLKQAVGYLSIHTFLLFNRIFSEQDKSLIECWEKFWIVESFKCELGHSLDNYRKMESDPPYNSCFQHDPRPRQAFDSYMMQMGHDQPTQKCSALCKMRITFSELETKEKDRQKKLSFSVCWSIF